MKLLNKIWEEIVFWVGYTFYCIRTATFYGTLAAFYFILSIVYLIWGASLDSEIECLFRIVRADIFFVCCLSMCIIIMLDRIEKRLKTISKRQTELEERIGL